MSADDAIGVVEFKGPKYTFYGVTWLQASENFSHYKSQGSRSKAFIDYVNGVFGNAAMFDTLEKAMEYAWDLQLREQAEYGVQMLGDTSHLPPRAWEFHALLEKVDAYGNREPFPGM